MIKRTSFILAFVCLLFAAADQALAQQRHKHCKDHPGSPKCLLFCSECGNHDCKCPPGKPFVYDDCARARDALQGAIYGGSVIVVSSTRGTLPQAEALAFIDEMSCEDAIKEATELTNFAKQKQAEHEQQEQAAGGTREDATANPPPAPRPAVGGPYAGWDTSSTESHDEESSDADAEDKEHGDDPAGDSPSPEEEAAQQAESNKEGADKPDPMDDPEYRKAIEKMEADFDSLIALGQQQDREAASDAAKRIAAEAEASLPPAVQAAADIESYIAGGGDSEDVVRGLVVGAGNDDPYWNMKPTVLDAIAQTYNAVADQIPLMPGFKVTPDAKFAVDLEDSEAQVEWGLGAVIDLGEEVAGTLPGVKLAGNLSNIAGKMGVANGFVNPISDERRDKYASDSKATSEKLQKSAEQYEQLAEQYSEQIKKTGEDITSPTHQHVLQGMAKKAEAYKKASRMVETNAKIRNENRVWIPGPWTK